MAQGATTRSELLEREYSAGVTQLIRAVILLVVFLILLYMFHFIPAPTTRLSMEILAAAGVAFSLFHGGAAGLRMHRAHSLPTVIFECPYCGYPMQFLKEPTEDFDCENCHRRVQFEDGKPVPVREITCTFCGTKHKVSVKAKQYTCDRCNRTLSLQDPNAPVGMPGEASELLQNYDVLLTDVGRQPTDVAMALESIMVCNLKEARRRMEDLPLTVVRNVPERKADAIRRRLRDLGATAIIRPTETGAAARGRRR